MNELVDNCPDRQVDVMVRYLSRLMCFLSLWLSLIFAIFHELAPPTRPHRSTRTSNMGPQALVPGT